VNLNWTNHDAYDAIEVYVDGELLQTLPGDVENADVSPTAGYHCFQLCGLSGPWSRCSDDCCLIVGYNQENLLWDFENDNGGFVVEGTGGWEWGQATFGPCADTASGKLWATALHDEYPPDSCWLLDSTPITIGASGAYLSIDHCYDTEFTYDGATVWFTTDDFWYETSEPVDGGDAGILGVPPLCSWVEGRKGFTGSSGGWVTDYWDLTDEKWTGEDVRLRFAFASDGMINAPGWMIDNISLLRNFTPPFDCDYTVTPTSGTVPFGTVHRLTLTNNYSGGAVFTRRFAGRIAVTIGNGTFYNPWRAGFTTVAPSSSFTTQFPVDIPALPSVIGENTFSLLALDVTPPPYNQPPYPPSGGACTQINVVTAQAP
jgi:hypothetical protein